MLFIKILINLRNLRKFNEKLKIYKAYYNVT